jgi:hypothetical protein
MTASKLDSSGTFGTIATESAHTRLLLRENQVVIRKNGLEFLSPTALPLWTEVQVDLHSTVAESPLQGMGVVVDCAGNRHTGYVVSLLLLHLTEQAQRRLQQLAVAGIS